MRLCVFFAKRMMIFAPTNFETIMESALGIGTIALLLGGVVVVLALTVFFVVKNQRN